VLSKYNGKTIDSFAAAVIQRSFHNPFWEVEDEDLAAQKSRRRDQIWRVEDAQIPLVDLRTVLISKKKLGASGSDRSVGGCQGERPKAATAAPCEIDYPLGDSMACMELAKTQRILQPGHPGQGWAPV